MNSHDNQVPASQSHKRIVLISIAVALLGAISWIMLFVQTPQPLFTSSRNRIFLFILLNIHTVAIMGLLGLIVRQSIRLMNERRQQKSGSIFTRNLIFAFMIFSVLPTFAVFFMAGKLITKSIDHWFRSHIKSGLESGIQLHRHHYRRLYEEIGGYSATLSRELESLVARKEKTAAEHLVRSLAQLTLTPPLLHHYSVYLHNTTTQQYTPSLEAEYSWWVAHHHSLEPPQLHFRRTFFALCMRSALTRQPFNFYGALYLAQQITMPQFTGYLIVCHHYPEAISNAITVVEQSLHDFDHLKKMRRDIYLNYLSSLILGTLIILFLAIWCAFYLARGIARPINELLGGMIRLQRGEKDVSVPTDPSSDLNALSAGFNAMTKQLQHSHETVEFRNAQLSTILEHIKEAVFFVNKFGRIVMYNVAAGELVEKYFHYTRFLNKKISYFGPPITTLIEPLVRTLHNSGKEEYSQEVSFSHEHEERTFLIHLVQIKSSAQGDGLLVLIEDLSNIVRMKKIQTWQAAAKQIAHEIKNPLTPIQLATQRLQRKYGARFLDEPTFLESTDTILAHVKIIKDLASHFSQFAQMPETVREPVDINTLIKKVVALYSLSYPDITFACELEEYLPSVTIDGRKVKRSFINLLDNSIRALQESGVAHGEVKLITRFKQGRKQVEIIIADNGPGMPDVVKKSLFVPHISTHTTHMGLGLAIVHEIITQSGGSIRLLSVPCGTTFQILFPV